MGDFAGVLVEADDEVGGDFLGSAVVGLPAAGEGEEGLDGPGRGGDEGADGGELLRVASVLEGVEVAAGGASAGAAAATLPRGFCR